MDVERIVAGLSENMVDAISYAKPINGHYFLLGHVGERTRKALVERALVSGIELTQLGLQVRARLNEGQG